MAFAAYLLFVLSLEVSNGSLIFLIGLALHIDGTHSALIGDPHRTLMLPKLDFLDLVVSPDLMQYFPKK